MAAALLLGLAAAVYGSHVVGGGLYWDDWENAATTEHPPDEGFLGPIDLSVLHFRPVLALLLPLPHLVFGEATAAHLAMALALAVLTSACLYLLLRTLGLARLYAAPIAALALLFPWSDSTRLWATGAVNNIAISLYLLGAVAALHGLEAEGRRRVLLRAASLAAFVTAILLYEIVAAAALLSVLLYAALEGWRTALRWWRLDVAVIGAAVAYAGAMTPRETQSVSGMLEHAATIADGAATLLGRTLLPFGAGGATVALILALGVVVAAGVVVLGAAQRSTLRQELRRWLAVATGAVVAVAAGYAAFVPGKDSYVPLAEGTGNRVNLLAGLGLVTLAFALAMLAGTLVFARLRRRGTVATAAALAFSVVVGTSFVGHAGAHKAEWRQAARLQEEILAAIRAADPPDDATVYAYGHRRQAAPGVPAYAVSWDLNGAVKARIDSDLSAYPLALNETPVCRERSTTPRPTLNGAATAPRYGRVFLVDVRRPRLQPVPHRARCEEIAARLEATHRSRSLAAGSPDPG